jgi:hypothetical protein
MTTHVAPQAKDWYPARESDAGNVHGVIGYLPASHGLTLITADTIQMVKVPIGATVMDCILESGNMDGSCTLQVGDGDDTDRYIDATNHGTAALTRRGQTDKVGVPSTYTAADTIDVVCGTDPSDSVAIRLDVFYITGVDTTP